LTPRSLRSLPVTLRPYADEGLSSWLSRTGAVYGCTARELLPEFTPFDRGSFELIDLQPSCDTLIPLGVLLATDVPNLEACTLTKAHPEWLNQWISLAEPLWNVTEHRTVQRVTVVPAVCPLCLSGDLREGRSQYSRLGWYCAILTICPIHRAPMVSCCSPNLCHQTLPTRGTLSTSRSCCMRCRRNLDRPQSWRAEVDQHAISALLFFESMLRTAVIERRSTDATEDGHDCADLIEPIKDLAWALMRPVSGTSLRALHFMQTTQFRMPPGFTTPVESSNWLSSAPLGVRRCLLAVIASLILPVSIRGALISEAGGGTSFWTKLRGYHSLNDRTEFSQRAERWNPLVVEVLDFYR
jgi:hypothetical protein